MSPVTDVLDVALQLSKAERARVAEALIESLEDGGAGEAAAPGDDGALEREIDRRLEAFRDGRTTAEDWRVVMRRVKAELASRQP